MSTIGNLEFLRSSEASNTVVGMDNTTGSRCVFSSVDKAHYTADDMAVKVYVCTEDNDDGHKDFYVGEKEFEARFGSFELQEI